MFKPCYEHCYLRYGKQYTKECDDKCHYAKAIKENKELIESSIIFPQTIGGITFYSKAELFEWVANMQKEFCSPPTSFLGCEVEKPIKVVFEGETKIVNDEDKYKMNMELLHKIGEHTFGVLDCSDMTEEEINRIIDEFNSLPNVNPIPYSDLVRAMENQEDIVGDTIKKLSDNK